jgi:hypothetical protein
VHRGQRDRARLGEEIRVQTLEFELHSRFRGSAQFTNLRSRFSALGVEPARAFRAGYRKMALSTRDSPSCRPI